MSFLQNAKTPASQSAQQPPAQYPPRAATRDPYAGMENVAMKREYLPAGRFALKVIQCSDGNLPDEIGGAFFFSADFEVLESSNPNLPAGKSVSWMTTLGTYKQYFQRDIKAFLGALANVEPSAIGDGAAREAVAESNPCRDRIVIAEGTDTGKLSKKGKPIIEVKFYPAPVAQ